MSFDFSEYVRSLGPDGEPPDAESFDRLLDALRRALVHEMKKRALWTAPPSYLGVYGGTSWSRGDLLEELLLDCYAFTFIRRLPGLKKQLLVRDNVDGLVFLNVRNFLHDAQKRHDPMGYRIFEVLHAAVWSLVDSGVLRVHDGDAKVRNDTVLGFSSHSLPPAPEGDESESQLRALVEAWTDDLMPELVTAWNRDEVLESLTHHLVGLPESGVEVFRFRDLVEPMKDEARSRWHGLRLVEEGETALEVPAGHDLASVVRLVRPDRGFEERETFSKLLDCTTERLDRLGGSHKTKEYLLRLWMFLRDWAAEPEDESDAEVPPAADDTVPSDKKLGEMLDIPRGRIPGLKQTLGDMVEACREAAAAGSSTVRERRAMGETTSRENLRLQTGAAAARWAEDHGSARERGDQPKPGETFVFARTRAYPVEWAILEEDQETPRWWVVPVDDHPLKGSADVRAGEDLCLRCGQGVWVGPEVFDTELRTGVLDEDVLARAREKKAVIEARELEASLVDREVNLDPEYVSWTGILEEARLTLVADAPRPGDLLRFARYSAEAQAPRTSGSWRPRALAAVLAAAVAGLSIWSFELSRQVDELTRPTVVAVSKTTTIRLLDGTRTKVTELSKSADRAILYLDLVEVERFPVYRLELLREDGEPVWTEEVEHDFELLLTLPLQPLSPGTYVLRLYGLDGQRREVVDEQKVRIVPR